MQHCVCYRKAPIVTQKPFGYPHFKYFVQQALNAVQMPFRYYTYTSNQDIFKSRPIFGSSMQRNSI